MRLKSILSVCALLAATIASAQKSLYIKPMIGYGISNVSSLGRYAESAPKMGYIPSYGAGLYLGIDNGKWIFETGIRYISTGYKRTNEKIFKGPIGDREFLGTGDHLYRYDHLGVPLAVQRSIMLSEKFSLLPGINFMISYNLGMNQSYGQPELKPDYYISGAMFYNSHVSMFAFGGASIHAGYLISNSFTIIGGPGVQYALSDLGGYGYPGEQHNYAFTFDLGVKWSLKKNKTAANK